jgi:hypothetical protein
MGGHDVVAEKRWVMNRFIAASAAAALAVLGMVGSAPAASAETLEVSNCEYTDYQVTPGTTVVFMFGPDCPFVSDYVAAAGFPTIDNVHPVQGKYLVWMQAIGRPSADAVCEAGWSPSWAQWPNEGAGGYTCERTITWGVFDGSFGAVAITINDPDDWAASISDRSYVFGCGVSDKDWPITGNCA